MATVPTNLTRLVPFGHNASVMFPEANLPVWARLLKQAPLSKAGWYFGPLLAVSFAAPKSPGKAGGGGRPDSQSRSWARSGERDEGDSSEGRPERFPDVGCSEGLSGLKRHGKVCMSTCTFCVVTQPDVTSGEKSS